VSRDIVKEDALPADTVMAEGKIQPGGQIFAKPTLSYPALGDKPKKDQEENTDVVPIPVRESFAPTY
jgi:hypothetical protein